MWGEEREREREREYGTYNASTPLFLRISAVTTPAILYFFGFATFVTEVYFPRGGPPPGTIGVVCPSDAKSCIKREKHFISRSMKEWVGPFFFISFRFFFFQNSVVAVLCGLK